MGAAATVRITIQSRLQPNHSRMPSSPGLGASAAEAPAAAQAQRKAPAG